MERETATNVQQLDFIGSFVHKDIKEKVILLVSPYGLGQ